MKLDILVLNTPCCLLIPTSYTTPNRSTDWKEGMISSRVISVTFWSRVIIPLYASIEPNDNTMHSFLDGYERAGYDKLTSSSSSSPPHRSCLLRRSTSMSAESVLTVSDTHSKDFALRFFDSFFTNRRLSRLSAHALGLATA